MLLKWSDPSRSRPGSRRWLPAFLDLFPALFVMVLRDQNLLYRRTSSPPLSYIHPQPSFLSHNVASKSFRGHKQPEHASLQKPNWKLSHPKPLPLRVSPIPVPFTPGPLQSMPGAPIPQQSWEPWVQSLLDAGKGQMKGPDWLSPEYKDPLVI